MDNKYNLMWKSLGLDLEAHENLLNVLSNAYSEIYLSQINRPEGMKYFDFVISEVHGLRIEELLKAKESNRKIIGTYCVFVPEEIIIALDAICVGLCAGAEIGYEHAERYLPRNICPLIKSFFGFTLAKVCPYVEACDLLVGETTCDGKKKAYEIFSEIKNLYTMEIPQLKNIHDLSLLFEEYKNFAKFLENFTKKKLSFKNLKKAIEIVNRKRRALMKLMEIRIKNPECISGKDALLINQISFYDDPVRFSEKLEELNRELESRENKLNKPKILISGCPMAIPNWKIPHIVESLGGIIVSEESCIGLRNIRHEVSTSGETVEDLIKNIAERYFKIDCACFTPNKERLENIKNLAENSNIDGIIHYSLQFCTPYLMEEYKVEKEIEDMGIPILKIETDYSQEDVGQLKTRIQAFLEMIGDV